MIIKLIDTNSKITDAWKTVFENVAEVTVCNDSIFNHPCDAIVSPANSYGYMNGGIDFAISKHLGWHIEKKLQEVIRKKYFGELLVGQAEIVTTENKLFPFLISAPTMRHPMTITRTPNVYLAMRAILLLIKYGELSDGSKTSSRIKSIAIPGLGTGIGNVTPMTCARQMRIAWEDVTNEKHQAIDSWKEMGDNFAFFYTDDTRNLKYDIP
ncbi:MAG: macro domain-containing protein [Bacteroidota bacterium]